MLSLENDFSVNIGDVLTLLCGVGYAVHIIYVDRYTEYQDPVTLTAIQLSVSAVLSWICAPIFDGSFPTEAMTPDLIIGMLYLGVFSSMIAYVLQNVCQKYTSPTAASLMLSTEAVFGMLFSIIFLQERLDPIKWAGCGVIILAIVLEQTKFSFLSKLFRKKSKTA